MYKTFEFTRTVHGKEETEMLVLSFPSNVDIVEVLHDIGLAYCMDSANSETCVGGLTLKELIEHLTPEMLVPYNVRMIWPSKETIHLDDETPVVSQYELKSYQQAMFDYRMRFRKMCDIAERFALRLERRKENAHSVISKWDASMISCKAVAWAGQFARSKETDVDKFFAKKLQNIGGDDEAALPDSTDPTNDYVGPPHPQQQSQQQTV